MKENPKVAIIIGSKSDETFMQPAWVELDGQGIEWEKKILSAHRQGEALNEYVRNAEKRGIRVFIAGAGLSAALPGVVASITTLPVIGVPVPSGPLKGVDAFLAIAQMPGGVPVATMGLGNQAPRNAAILAMQILAVESPEVQEKLRAMRDEMRGS